MTFGGQDKVHSLQMMQRDVIRCSRALARGAINHGELEQLIICCTGLEHLLSRNMLQRFQAIKDARDEHVRAVLEAQTITRNDEGGQDDVARVSESSSAASRERAGKIASLAASVV